MNFFQPAKESLYHSGTKLLSVLFFDGLRFPQGRVFEDWTLAPIIYSRCEKAVFLPEYKYCYVVHQGSIMRTHTVKRFADCVSADYDHYCFFNNRGIETYNSQISDFARCDFLKCVKYYTPTAENKRLLKQSYEKCKKMNKSKIIKFVYAFPFLFHILALIKERLR